MQALVECEGESIDLSGDMGAVGRIVVPDTAKGNHEMFMDLKGMLFSSSHSFFKFISFILISVSFSFLNRNR